MPSISPSPPRRGRGRRPATHRPPPAAGSVGQAPARPGPTGLAASVDLPHIWGTRLRGGSKPSRWRARVGIWLTPRYRLVRLVTDACPLGRVNLRRPGAWAEPPPRRHPVDTALVQQRVDSPCPGGSTPWIGRHHPALHKSLRGDASSLPHIRGSSTAHAHMWCRHHRGGQRGKGRRRQRARRDSQAAADRRAGVVVGAFRADVSSEP